MATNGKSGFEDALARIDGTARSLKQSAAQALSIESAANRLASGGNEHAASGEQVRAAVETLAVNIEASNSTVQSLARSQARVAEQARDTQQGLETAAAGLLEMKNTILSVRRDGDVLSSAAEGTATTLEEMVRSIKSVAQNAENAAAAGEELLTTAVQTSASVADVAARGQSNAAVVEEVAVTIEQMSKGLTRLAQDAAGVGEKTGQATSQVASLVALVERTAKDATEMAGAVDETGVSAEQMARNVRAVAEHARALEKAAAENATSMTAVAASVEQVAATAEKNAATVESNAAAIEQLSRTSAAVAQSAEQISAQANASAQSASVADTATRRIRGVVEGARAISERVNTSAREGGSTVGRSIQGIVLVREAMGESASVIKEMGKRAEEIADFVQTINLIADRTNLLSLNASIEAARAGEHGRGFAVVAEEIRALADKAAAASLDISKIIRGLQTTAREAVTSSSDGMRVADESTRSAADSERALGNILKGVEELSGSVREIDTSSQEQAQSVSTLVQNIARMNEEGRSIQRAAAEQTRVSQSLAQAGQEMRMMARQTTEATSEQARALREVVKANALVTQSAEKVARATEEQALAAAEVTRAASRMRTLTTQTTAGMTEATRAVSSVAAVVQDVGSTTQRSVTGLAEQARGASEVAKGMDDARKQSMLTAKAVAEQAKAAKQVETAARDVARIASDVTNAAAEQGKATASLLRDAEEVRRIARQNARALGEQSDVVQSLAAAAARHTAAMTAISTQTAEQSGGAEQISHAVTDMRTRAREVLGAVATQARNMTAMASDVAGVAADVGLIRKSNSENATLTDAERARFTRVDALAALGGDGIAPLMELLADPSWSVRRQVVAALAAAGPQAVVLLCTSLRTRRDKEARIAATVDALVASSAAVDEAVAALCEDKNPAVVADAAQILGRRKSSRSVPLLARLLVHADDNVAVAGLEALGRVGGRAAVDSLIRAVRGGNFFRVFPAIDVLGRSADPRAVEPLAQLLDEPHYASEAARALGRTGDKAAVAPLLRMMGRMGEAGLRTAALALVDLMERYQDAYGVTAPVEDVLRIHPDSQVLARRMLEAILAADPVEQVGMCGLLSAMGGESAIPMLSTLLDAAPAVARAAADAVQKLSQDGSEDLVASMRDGDSARRLVLLPLMRRSSAAAAVQLCLRDPDPLVRALACDTLAQLGHVASVPLLFALLSDGNARVAQAATAAIQSLGSASTQAQALEAARSPVASVRRAALRILSYFGYAAALDIFLKAIAEGDQGERDTAIQGLPFLDDKRAVDVLLDAARAPAPRTRASALRSLANLVSDPRTTAYLLKALADEDAWCRYYAAQSLGKLHCEVAAGAIARLLEDPAGQVRVAALEALTRLQSDVGWQAIERAADSPDPDLQRAALIGLGLGQQRRPDSLSILLSAATSADATTRLVAVGALGNSNTPGSLRALARAATDTDENVRLAAIAALGLQPDAEATVLLADLVKESASRDQIMDALSNRTAGRITGLLAALDSADDELAPFLTSALARMHRPDGNAALLQVMASPNAAARRAAASALAALGTSEAVLAIQRAAVEDADPDVRRISLMLAGR